VWLLAQLSSLEVLNLSNTSVDDVAVDSLVRLRHLGHLDILGTQISEAGLARLRRALPDCRIRADRLHPVTTDVPKDKLDVIGGWLPTPASALAV